VKPSGTSTHAFDSSRCARFTAPVRASAISTSFRFCSRFNCWTASDRPSSAQSIRGM
jgi:hypothetical protein